MPKKTRVLVIDDDEDIVKLAKIMIGYMGYEVVITTDNLSVLDLLEDNFDLLLLDIQMPHLDGFEICRLVRQSLFKDIKIVLFSASVDDDVIMKGKEVGADEVISKPFSIEKIKETIIRALENEPRRRPDLGEDFPQIYAP